jgi:hypothetical protein
MFQKSQIALGVTALFFFRCLFNVWVFAARLCPLSSGQAPRRPQLRLSAWATAYTEIVVPGQASGGNNLRRYDTFLKEHLSVLLSP